MSSERETSRARIKAPLPASARKIKVYQAGAHAIQLAIRGAAFEQRRTEYAGGQYVVNTNAAEAAFVMHA